MSSFFILALQTCARAGCSARHGVRRLLRNLPDALRQPPWRPRRPNSLRADLLIASPRCAQTGGRKSEHVRADRYAVQPLPLRAGAARAAAAGAWALMRAAARPGAGLQSDTAARNWRVLQLRRCEDRGLQPVARLLGSGNAARTRAAARMRAQEPAPGGLAAQRVYESGAAAYRDPRPCSDLRPLV